MNSQNIFHRKAFSTRAILLAIIIVFCLPIFVSCNKNSGWGLVLFPNEDSPIPFGSIVKVYFKSNIMQTYGVQVPNSKDKEELEIWRVEFYKTKKKAQEAANEYGDLLPIVGISNRSGLLLREEPKNTSDQVYRFKINQAVKLLKKVDGDIVQTGGEILEGAWYYAMSEDGTKGYVYSNQLVFWNTQLEERPISSEKIDFEDPNLINLTNSTWRPTYFSTMVNNRTVDLNSFSYQFGLFVDGKSQTIRIKVPEISINYLYSSIEKDDKDVYKLLPGDATFRFTSKEVVEFTIPSKDVPNDIKEAIKKKQEARSSKTAKQESSKNNDFPDLVYSFTTQKIDIQAVMNREQQRRLSQLSNIISNGEKFYSQEYGSLQISKTGAFIWQDYDMLCPSVIPENAGITGTISMDLFYTNKSKDWDGAFTMSFDGDNKAELNFAYKISDNELILAIVNPAFIDRGVINKNADITVVAILTRN